MERALRLPDTWYSVEKLHLIAFCVGPDGYDQLPSFHLFTNKSLLILVPPFLRTGPVNEAIDM